MQNLESKRACVLKNAALSLLLLSASLLALGLGQPREASAGGDQSGKCAIEVELEALSDIRITAVDSDGYFGSIYYETPNRVAHALDLEQGSGGRMLPMKIQVDERAVRLSDLRGTRLRSLKAARKDCRFSHPVIGTRPLSHQWTIRAELAY